MRPHCIDITIAKDTGKIKQLQETIPVNEKKIKGGLL
jgi:hypothetical protein